MNKLRQMTIFATIVEQGSISSAAEQLNLSKSVISQHLKALEQELGLTLLKRTTRRQALTDAGAQFYQKCKHLNDIADAAWQQLEPLKSQAQGKIKITASHALMDTLVVPAIVELLKQHPKLRPELISEDKHLDFMKHNIDLAIRVGVSADSNYKQKKLGSFRDILCGIPPLVANAKVDELPYVANSWQGQTIHHEFLAKSGETWHYKNKPSYIANSFHSCLSLIRSGAGIGLIPSIYFDKKGGDLIDLVPNMDLPENPIYALHPFTNNTPVNVKVCSAAIERQLLKQQSK